MFSAKNNAPIKLPEETQLDEIETTLKAIALDPKQNQEEFESRKEELGILRLEIHNIKNAAKKKELQDRIRACDTHIASITRKLLVTKDQPSSVNSYLSHHERILEKKQQDSLDMLIKSRQTLHETLSVAAETSAELAKQNEKTKNMKAKMEDINADLKHSNSLLNKMSRWWRG